MTNKIDDFIEKVKSQLDTEFRMILETKAIPEYLKKSMLYSLLAGGKRLRPVLLFASYNTFTAENAAKTLHAAMALEMVHTYSLIHDDLPAMDDDDIRRGAPTNHQQFDEATAILAGDALLTYSFELISEDQHLSSDEKVYVLRALAGASGPEGMVAGQILDMEGENRKLTIAELEKIHEHKTGKLISFAILTGAYLANVTEEKLGYLRQFAYFLGLIFQVQDDILDVVGDPDKLGKPVGSDLANEKSTYPELLGLKGAIEQKELYAKKAKDALMRAYAGDSLLADLLEFFTERDH